MDVRLVREVSSAGDYHRSVNFRVGSDAWKPLLPTWNNRIPAIRSQKECSPSLTELYSPITLEELREVDSDDVAQASLIRRLLTPQAGIDGLAVMKVLVTEGDRVTDTDLRYLVDLLPPPGCPLTAVPLVYHYHMTPTGRARADRPVDLDRYFDVCKRFLEFSASKPANHNLALTVPSNVPHSRIPDLLRLYKDIKTPIAIIDAFGSTTRDRYPQLRALTGDGIAFGKGKFSNLKEKHGENFAVYSFDSKPSSGRADVVAAQNLLQLDAGYSSFGPLRSPRTMIKRSPTTPPPKPPRILAHDKLCYQRSNLPGALDDLRQWHVKRNTGRRTATEILADRRCFENESIIHAARALDVWAASGTLSKELGKKNLIATDLKLLRRRNGQTRQRTLD